MYSLLIYFPPICCAIGWSLLFEAIRQYFFFSVLICIPYDFDSVMTDQCRIKLYRVSQTVDISEGPPPPSPFFPPSELSPNAVFFFFSFLFYQSTIVIISLVARPYSARVPQGGYSACWSNRPYGGPLVCILITKINFIFPRLEASSPFNV